MEGEERIFVGGVGSVSRLRATKRGKLHESEDRHAGQTNGPAEVSRRMRYCAASLVVDASIERGIIHYKRRAE
jgi:hypothetical protein